MKSKLSKASRDVKNIVEVKRLIKRNMKMKEPAEKLSKKKSGNLRAQKTQRKQKEKDEKFHKIIHIPFIVLNY